jgi:hypothetical protein
MLCFVYVAYHVLVLESGDKDCLHQLSPPEYIFYQRKGAESSLQNVINRDSLMGDVQEDNNFINIQLCFFRSLDCLKRK